jgi:hypothetical protein
MAVALDEPRLRVLTSTGTPLQLRFQGLDQAGTQFLVSEVCAMRWLLCLIAVLCSVPVWAAPSVTVLPDRILTGHGNKEFFPRFSTYLPNSLTVPAGETVLLSGAVTYDAIENAGTLRCKGPVTLTVTHLVNLPGATFDCQGSVIVGRNVPIDTARDPYQFGNGLINMGRLILKGTTRVAFTVLTADAAVGATTLSLLVPPDWQVGDEVLLPDMRQVVTNNDSPASHVLPRKDARLFITGKTRSTLTISVPLGFERASITDPDGAVKFRPRIANLTRGMSIASENPEGTRWHVIMLGHDATWDVQGVMFSDLGRTKATALDSTTADDSGRITKVGLQQVGRYTWHAHHTQGFGTVFRNNVLRDDLSLTKWGHATHTTHDSLVEDSIALGFVGSGFVTEDGNEIRNVYRRNVAAYIKGNGVGAVDNFYTARPGAEGAGFWFHSARQVIEGNESWNNEIGFNVFQIRQVGGTVPSTPGGHPDTKFYPKTNPISFDHNTLLANVFSGLETWESPRDVPLKVFATNLYLGNNGRTQIFTGAGIETSLRIQGLYAYAQGGQGFGIDSSNYVHQLVIEGGEIKGTHVGVNGGTKTRLDLTDLVLQNTINFRPDVWPSEMTLARVQHRQFQGQPKHYIEIRPGRTAWPGTGRLEIRDDGMWNNHTAAGMKILDWQGTGETYRIFPINSRREYAAWPSSGADPFRNRCPVVGITMGECWDRYGLAYGGGAVARAEEVSLEGVTHALVVAGLTPTLGPPRAVVTYPVSYEPAKLSDGAMTVHVSLTGQKVGIGMRYQFDNGAIRRRNAEDWGIYVAGDFRRQVYILTKDEGLAPGQHQLKTWVEDASGNVVPSSETVFTYTIGATAPPIMTARP